MDKEEPGMSDIKAIDLARDFRKCDKKYEKAAKEVKQLIDEGYTPEEALMLAGFGGYEIDD